MNATRNQLGLLIVALRKSNITWDFRITGRAQFLIGTVPGYMNVKFRYTEFQYR